MKKIYLILFLLYTIPGYTYVHIPHTSHFAIESKEIYTETKALGFNIKSPQINNIGYIEALEILFILVFLYYILGLILFRNKK